MDESSSVTSSSNVESHFFQSNIPRSESIKIELGPWVKYLADTEEAYDLAESDNLFDLIEQGTIDSDCKDMIEMLGIPKSEESVIYSTLRTIITIYSKSEKKRYKIENGWVPLLAQLISQNNSKLLTYVTFKEIRNLYIPEVGTYGFVLRLLLLYHDPQLCRLLDINEVSLEVPTEHWMNRLFIRLCSQSVCDKLLKFIFRTEDSYMLFFIALSLIISHKNDIEKIEYDGKEKIENFIEYFPRSMDDENIENIIDSAKNYDANTPGFFKKLFAPFMFGKKRERKPSTLPKYLPTSAKHVIDNTHEKLFNYFITDCRSLDLYHAGWFNTQYRFFVDCELQKRHPIIIEQGLLHQIEQYQNDELKSKLQHICLVGSGLKDDDDCVEAVAEILIKKNTKYVSILHGGYKIAHQLIRLNYNISEYLINHVEKQCVFCNQELLSVKDFDSAIQDEIQSENVEFEKAKTPTPSIRFKDRIKQRLTRVQRGLRNQLLSCVNPADPICQKKSKSVEDNFSMVNLDDNIYEEIEPLYSNQSVGTSSDIYGVFDLKNITSSQSSSWQSGSLFEPKYASVLMNDWLNLPDKERVFKCKQVLSNGSFHASRLIVTNKKIIILRRIDKNSKDKALLILNCPIGNILEITTGKKIRNVITIHFDQTGMNNSIPYEKIKLLMPEKDEFVNLIQQKFKRV